MISVEIASNASLDQRKVANAPDLQLVPDPAPLTDYLLEITDWQTLDSIDNPTQGVAQITTHLASLSDGSRNVVRAVLAADKQFETPFCFATPLGTRVKGFNTYTAIQAAKQGMDSLVIGAPQVWPKVPLQSHEAEAFAKIVRFNYETTRHGIAQVAIGGYSWAAMRAPAEAQYLHRLGIHVPFAITKDACLAEETSLAETQRDMTPAYVASEVWEGAKAVLSKETDESWLRSAKRLGHLVGTVGISPAYAITHARVTRELWRGEAGSFVQHTPADTALIAHFMADSPFNDHPVYKNAIELLPHGRVVLEEGVHFTPSRRNIVRTYIGQVAYGQRLSETGASAAELADRLDVPFGVAA